MRFASCALRSALETLVASIRGDNQGQHGVPLRDQMPGIVTPQLMSDTQFADAKVKRVLRVVGAGILGASGGSV